jgi:hypothetical protein
MSCGRCMEGLLMVTWLCPKVAASGSAGEPKLMTPLIPTRLGADSIRRGAQGPDRRRPQGEALVILLLLPVSIRAVLGREDSFRLLPFVNRRGALRQPLGSSET